MNPFPNVATSENNPFFFGGIFFFFLNKGRLRTVVPSLKILNCNVSVRPKIYLERQSL